MPLYEYLCGACGHRFEKLQRVTASTTDECPKCGEPARRQLGAPALQFKGTGWYVTDYARKGSSGEAQRSEKTGTTDSSSNTSESKKSDSKDSSTSDSKASSPATGTTANVA